jgi:exodeoxyribonuclease VII large subunit
VRCDDALQQQTLQLNKQVRYTIEQQQRELTHLTSIIRLSSPDEALKRGFAILKKDGKIITDPSPLNPGDEIDITLKDTEITTRIIQKSPRNGNEFDL